MEGTDAQNYRRIFTRQLQQTVSWMWYLKSENYDLPNTTEEWESDFNEDIFNNFGDDSITMKNEVK